MSEKIDAEESLVRSEKGLPIESSEIFKHMWKKFALIACVAMATGLVFYSGFVTGGVLSMQLAGPPAECRVFGPPCKPRRTPYRYYSKDYFAFPPRYVCRTCAAG